MEATNNRRKFLKSLGVLEAGLLVPSLCFSKLMEPVNNGNIHEFGKRSGYTNY